MVLKTHLKNHKHEWAIIIERTKEVLAYRRNKIAASSEKVRLKKLNFETLQVVRAKGLENE